MRKFACFLILISTVAISIAWVTSPFTTWQNVIERSSNIIVVRCDTSPQPDSYGGGLTKTDVSVVDVLKGPTNANSAPLVSSYLPRQGEYYLVFANFSEGYYNAYADYNIVLVGSHYEKEMAAGNTLDEKVRSLLKRRLGFLTKQIELEEKEKQRLEEGLKK
jgi:hypothetical protein